MCYYNQMIKNRKYVKNKKNGGVVPTVTDRRIEYVPTGCGNCKECKKQKAREWMVRLMEDIKTNTNGKFITLTFSNESITKLIHETITRTDQHTGRINTIKILDLKGYERDNAIATRAVHNFRNRWRKKYGKTIRHWLITELGHKGTENIHLHGIIWPNIEGEWEQVSKEVEKIWQYGYIWAGNRTISGKLHNYVNNATIKYATKYHTKVDAKHKEYKSKILTSPGIGANFINTPAAEQIQKELKETYKTSTGHEISLPIYWRNKLFTDIDKERLWIKRLDKQERWINGQKIDISKGEEQYKKMLQTARKENIELGYGVRPNENRKQYEEQRREIMIQTRLKNSRSASPAGQ